MGEAVAKKRQGKRPSAVGELERQFELLAHRVDIARVFAVAGATIEAQQILERSIPETLQLISKLIE